MAVKACNRLYVNLKLKASAPGIGYKGNGKQSEHESRSIALLGPLIALNDGD